MALDKSWARIVWWGLLILSLGVIVIGIPAAPKDSFFLASAPEELAQISLSPLETEALAFSALFLRVLLIAGFLAAALLIFLRSPNDKPAVIFSAALITIGVTNGVINYLPEPASPR